MKFRNFLFLCASLACAGAAPASTLIVPVYGNTSAQYRGALAAAKQQNIIAVINPDEGVGGRRIGKLASFSSKINASGSLSAGYINTNYGRRSLDAVRGDINKYISNYRAKAIFLDEFSDSPGAISMYKSIYDYAKGKGLKVIGNPGTFVPSGYANTADILITYEGGFNEGFSKFKQKSWTKRFPKKKFGVIVNGTRNFQEVINKANSQNVEFVYATDASEPSPYGRLSSNFSEQVAATRGRGISVSSIPEPTSGALVIGSLLAACSRRTRRPN